ncbi:MAG: hypothetical protein HQK91_12555, partial [Nitrospirae bacterium]|nr:hypothetical protein [Nitrospirota bacterium]
KPKMPIEVDKPLKFQHKITRIRYESEDFFWVMMGNKIYPLKKDSVDVLNEIANNIFSIRELNMKYGISLKLLQSFFTRLHSDFVVVSV